MPQIRIIIRTLCAEKLPSPLLTIRAFPARELGIMRIQESGGSDFLDCFDDEFLELISTATSVIVTEAYFLEEGDSEEMELVAVSYEEFMNAESDDSVGEDIPVIVSGDNG